jgi:hypothetical protein
VTFSGGLRHTGRADFVAGADLVEAQNAVDGLTPSAMPTARHEAPLARNWSISSALGILRGRPNVRPLDLAFRMPALTRSTMRLRSSSATAPSTVKTILPVGVDVSTC